MDEDWLDAGRHANRRLRKTERWAKDSGVDLPVTHLLVLADLLRSPLSLRTLAERHGVPSSTASSIVAALEKKGYATRVADPADGRMTVIEPTQDGRDVLTPLLDGSATSDGSTPKRRLGDGLPRGIKDPNALFRSLHSTQAFV